MTLHWSGLNASAEERSVKIAATSAVVKAILERGTGKKSASCCTKEMLIERNVIKESSA